MRLICGRVLALLSIGDKRTQRKDIPQCQKEVSLLKKSQEGRLEWVSDLKVSSIWSILSDQKYAQEFDEYSDRTRFLG